jgi:hypothetical protein
MQVRLSRHARRRAKLYRIPETTIRDLVLSEAQNIGHHSLVSDVPGFRYPIKVVYVVEDDVAIVVTAYPLKKGRKP